MIFEDAHWADPTSLEAFGRVVDWITHSRGFLIVTHRPEFAPPWTGQPQVTTLTLNRLSKRDMGAIIERIIGNRGVPDDVRQDIIERTDGIPLFVEELTKAVLETGSEANAAQAVSRNSTWLTPWYLTRLAEAHAKLGRCDEAWRRIFEAFEEIEKGGEVQHQAEINRVAGEIALIQPEIDVTNAERYFEKALAAARQQQAKSWELRAAMSLARLWRSQGKLQQARELLAPVYGWFTEGFDTRDLKDAKSLLNELTA
jgi:tetratricopeptide (TPR) repeat protein